MIGGSKVPWPLHRTAPRGPAWSAPRVTVSDRHIEGGVYPHRATSALWALRSHCVSHSDGLRPTDVCVAATAWWRQRDVVAGRV
jgi:hypothetical protein